MSVQLYEDQWDVESQMLRAKDIEPHSHPTSCYPWPELESAGRIGQVTLRTVVLENRWLKATIVPDLGGRIIQLQDKFSGNTLWPRIDCFSPIAGGSRGVFLPDGLTPVVGRSGDTAMSSVNFQLHEPADEGDRGGVILSSVTTDGLDWSLCYSLAPDSKTLLVECRAHNRQVFPLETAVGFEIDKRDCLINSGKDFVALAPGSRSVCLVAECDIPPKEIAETSICSLEKKVIFGPRQTRQWSMQLVVIEKSLPIVHFADGIAFGAEKGKIRVDVSTNLPGQILFLLDETGKTWESKADLSPESPLIAELPASVQGAIIKGTSTDDFRWERGQTTIREARKSSLELALLEANKTNDGSRESQIFHAIDGDEVLTDPPFGLEGLAALIRAMRFSRKQQWEECLREIDQAINFRADDHLLWWFRAAVERHMNENDGERASFLNAQYLAPMEGMLRVEAFLSTPIGASPGPSPLVKPLAFDPDALLDVISILWDCGFYQDAARLIDECLQINEIPLVRYMYAYSLIHSAKLMAEAAEQIRINSTAKLAPPFPNRKWERKVIAELTERYETDENLRWLSELIKANPG